VALDNFEKVTFFNTRSTEFLWSFLCHQAQHTSFAFSGVAEHTGALGNVMLGYQLFDMLVWSCGLRDGLGLRKVVPRTAPSFALSEKLTTLVHSLTNWMEIIPSAQSLAKEASQNKISRSSLGLGQSPHTGLAWAISNLLQVSREKGQATWHKTLMNIYAMAFVIQWYSPVGVPPVGLRTTTYYF
jgi:hypothetical protein